MTLTSSFNHNPTHLLASALSYASLGWYVFPCHSVRANSQCSCGKATCDNTGKHPRTLHGVNDATTDPIQIKRWWTQWPDANIGVATGASGLVVIDIDPRHGGDETWAQLRTELGSTIEDTLTALTGGGGRHLFFHALTGVPLHNTSGKLGEGIDTRALGGYIIAAPSNHKSGRKYQWEASTLPGEVTPAPLPGALAVRLMEGTPSRPTPTEKKRAATPRDPDGQWRIPEGQRNATLTRLAGSMRRVGFSPEAMCAALLVENRTRCVPPLPDEEVIRIAESVARYEPGAPILPDDDVSATPTPTNGDDHDCSWREGYERQRQRANSWQRDFEALYEVHMEFLRAIGNPDLPAQQKISLVTTYRFAHSKQDSTDAPPELVTVYLRDNKFSRGIATEAGAAPDTVGRDLKRASQFGLLKRQVSREIDDGKYVTKLRIAPPAKRLVDSLRLVADWKPAEGMKSKRGHGGKRVPRCQTCGPETPVMEHRTWVCTGCGEVLQDETKVHQPPKPRTRKAKNTTEMVASCPEPRARQDDVPTETPEVSPTAGEPTSEAEPQRTEEMTSPKSDEKFASPAEPVVAEKAGEVLAQQDDVPTSEPEATVEEVLAAGEAHNWPEVVVEVWRLPEGDPLGWELMVGAMTPAQRGKVVAALNGVRNESPLQNR